MGARQTAFSYAHTVKSVETGEIYRKRAFYLFKDFKRESFLNQSTLKIFVLILFSKVISLRLDLDMFKRDRDGSNIV